MIRREKLNTEVGINAYFKWVMFNFKGIDTS